MSNPNCRFGPGILSRRHRQTLRLRELRSRRSRQTPKVDNAASLSRVPAGSGQVAAGAGGTSKRRREPTGQARNFEQQHNHKLPGPSSADDAPSREGGLRPAAHARRGQSSSQHNKRKVDGACGDDGEECEFTGWGRDDSGLNPWKPGPRRRNGERKKGVLANSASVLCCSSRDSTVPPSLPNPPAITVSAPILPVRSAPASSKARASRGSGRSQGSSGKRTKQAGTTTTTTTAGEQPAVYREKNLQRESGKAAEDGVSSHGPPCASYYCTGSSSAGHNTDDGALHPSSGASAQAGVLSAANVGRPALPGVADNCGGIILRMSPAERPLEPWDTTVAPLRAMCDIEPSLSRAGIEYRGIIHAVEGAQEAKALARKKVWK